MTTATAATAAAPSALETVAAPNDEFVAVTPHGIGGYWGRGSSIDEAKQELRRRGGNLNHVIVYQLPAGATGGHVDDLGNLRWTWGSDQARLAWDRGPVTVVHRRGVQTASS